MKSYIAYLFEVFNFGTDVSFGIFSVSILASLFDVKLTPGIIILSMFFVLLPDIDVFVEYPLRMLGKAQAYSYHQVYTHFPLLYVPPALVLMFFDPFLGVLLLVNITLHLLHDSIGTGWGIAWLWPFNKNYYKFFSGKDGSFSTNVVQVWNPPERSRIWSTYGDRYWVENLYINSWRLSHFKHKQGVGPNLDWLRNNYRKLRWFFLGEILITSLGAAYLVFMMKTI